jgi:hypothetical protein
MIPPVEQAIRMYSGYGAAQRGFETDKSRPVMDTCERELGGREQAGGEEMPSL